MKLSSIKLQSLGLEADLAELYQKINNTRTDCPRNKSVVDIFQDMVAKYPDKTAIALNDVRVTYCELDERSNKMAHWLIGRGVKKESAVAIYLDRSIEMVVAIMGILKAGGAYLPLNHEYPIERNRNMIAEGKASVLISETAFIREANMLQWLCNDLLTVLCVDGVDFYNLEERANPLMKKELWEYIGETADDDIAGGGWTNSYTKEKFSRQMMDEYSVNAYLKLQSYLDPTKKVLEIGCASGITMYRIAPYVKSYYGTDISNAIISYNEQRCADEGIDNIRLKCLGAGDIDLIDEKDFDIIIINSVIQAFNGLNYLRQIIRKCYDLLGDKGIVFVGDVMDLDKKAAMVNSIHEFKRHNPMANTKLDFSNELFVSRRFFDDLRVEIAGIDKVFHSEKIFTIPNELTDFRYDTILSVDKSRCDVDKQIAKHKQQFDRLVLNNMPATPCGVQVSPDQLSNIMFTSGSTGIPKGVQIEHRSIIRLVVNSDFLDVRPSDRWLQTAEISFDPSCMEIFGALLNGATLCLVSKECLLDSEALHRYMVEHDITILQLVSALFHELSSQKPALFSSVRRLVVGGEVLSPLRVKLVKQACPKLTIVNAYGPTENCVVSTAFEVDQEYEKIPIGKPISNSGLYVMDADLQLKPVGIVGELFVFGEGLSRGYLGNEEFNNTKFVPHPFIPGERMYRTGDLVRLRPDLNLEFIGRKDSQVKINGHRVELLEIESAIKNILQTDQVLIALKGGNKVLCAYVSLAHDLSVDVIKKLLAIRLPEHMVPVHIIKIAKFTLTPNGKIDVLALPEPDLAGESAQEITAPENAAEENLLAIFKEVLQLEKIGVTHNFFQHGGHSLLATQLLSRLNRAFNTNIRLKSIFNYPTVRSLAPTLAKANAVVFEEIAPVAAQRYHELSHAQQRLWVLNHMPEYRTAYNMTDAYSFKGTLQVDLLEKAFCTIVQRHEILRTVFTMVDGHPMQEIVDSNTFDFSLQQVDLRTDYNRDVTAKTLVTQQASQVFDLEKGPLIKATLLRLEETNFTFVISMHHIIGDGWSFWVLIKEALELYNAYARNLAPNLEPLKIQYKDYVAWQNKMLRHQGVDTLEKYWKRQLGDAPPALNLPIDFPRKETKTSKAKRIIFTLSEDESKFMVESSRKEGVTLFMYVLAMINVMLYRYTKQTTLTVGTPIAGRHHQALENQIGLYLNTLALRTTVDPERNFGVYLNKIKDATLEAFEHQDYPFDLLVETLNLSRDLLRSPLFDVGFTWQNVDGPEGSSQTYSLQGLEVTHFRHDHQEIKTDLWFHGWEINRQLYISLTYSTDLYKPETIDGLVDQFKSLAALLVEHSERNIQDLVNSLSSKQKEKTMENYEKVKEAKFDRFKTMKKVPINLGAQALVNETFFPGTSYPVVVKPNLTGLILAQWVRNNTSYIQEQLHKSGGILFRDFGIHTMEAFQEVVAALSDKGMTYVDQSSPRTLLSDKTYTSTDHPADQVINMHNELSYSHDWPMQILFYCLYPSTTGGETPIADSRKVLALLSEKTRARFEAKGILYVRNLMSGLGLSWRDVYQTSDKHVVEAYCRERGIAYTWLAEDNLRISWARPAVHVHPVTGEKTWFNHGFFFNAINLDESVHEAVGDRDNLPFNTFYGDGTEIEPEVLAELKDAFEKTKVYFPWKKGDILLLDNMLMAHGRNSFSGDRKILVAMNNAHSQIKY
ncbi:condensation domain-containing protein [Chryseolinea lacunae]|uniref:AMP-binding protein n=1 Tax=Chryseolinea lacunae TaxID=2801331 RepID=A0ABS1KWL8_9BACT|nr:condensation domain-containing protein [Chryseolinea lacunae]MBL0743077.1 AMP-binding protein [Chryseolinea lacunae]